MKIKSTVAALAAALAGLAFAGSASAHNIPMYAAKAKCREYVQSVIDDPRTAYISANMKTANAFPGHNHYVRCTVSYDTAATEHTKRYACVETLDVYYLPENADRNHTIFMRHVTAACSRRVLTGPRPG